MAEATTPLHSAILLLPVGSETAAMAPPTSQTAQRVSKSQPRPFSIAIAAGTEIARETSE